MALSSDTLEKISKRLAFIYNDESASELTGRINVIASNHAKQPTSTGKTAVWDETDTVLITYGNSILSEGQAPLHVLDEFCKEYLKDVFSIVHLLPFFPYSSDDGFSVINFQEVNPELGDWKHIHNIGKSFDLMFDFVLNHVSRDSLWFADFLENMPPGNKYFIEADPSDKRLSQVIRPRAQALMVPIRTRHDERHVWATFSKDQLDLNYQNSDVLMQAVDIILFYVRQGARVLRLDAVAFLWKTLGTSCVHLPQTHEIIKLFRDILADIAPGVILLTETNVPHQENISYFGDGDEAHMVYQFSLPPLLLHAIYSGTTQYLRQWLADLKPAPEGCTFFNFTASHDGVGLRALEGIIASDEVDTLLDAMRDRGGFVSTRSQPDGSETPYELNISYFDAMREPQPQPQHDIWHVPRFILSQTVVLSLQGVPAVYIHSLFSTPNYQQGVELTSRTRTINRRRWESSELIDHINEPQSAANIVFSTLTERLKLRRTIAAFHPGASQEILNIGESLLGLRRTSVDGSESVIALFNFTPRAHTVESEEIGLIEQQVGNLMDLLSGEAPSTQQPDTSLAIVIPAYGCYWLTTNCSE